MSAGTQRLQAAMDAHAKNTEACKAANLAKDTADKAFKLSDEEVAAAIAQVQAEQSALALDSLKLADVPADKQPATDSAAPV